MAFDIFLKITGQMAIPGESKDADHKDEIQLESFSFNGHAPKDISTGQAAGKVQMAPLMCFKHTDIATPLLLKAMCENKIIKAEITVRKAGGTKQQEYFTCTLENASVASFSLAAKQEEAIPIPVETFGIAYSKMTVEYKAQSALGITGGPVNYLLDLTKP
jgi:type VI secretion system secreted protein Hcp